MPDDRTELLSDDVSDPLSDDPTEPLPDDVAGVLAALLDPADPVHAALLRQVPHLRVTGRCGCGCGSADFALDVRTVAAAATGAMTVVAAEATLLTGDGECPGEVLLFAQGGYLSWLEVCSWSDDTEVTLAAARGWLRARRPH